MVLLYKVQNISVRLFFFYLCVSRNVINNAPKPKKKDPMRTRGEILIEDLPPIQDLHISVPAEECMELGKISSIVDQLGMYELK